MKELKSERGFKADVEKKKKRKIFYSKSDDMPIIKSNRLKACYARINIW